MNEETPGYPINYVARMTGLTPHAIRKWERRYELIQPRRTASGRRIYSDAHIDRLRLLRRATAAGYSIGKLSRLAEAELRNIVRGTFEPVATSVSSESKDENSSLPWSDLLEKCRVAVRQMDWDQLDALLAKSGARMGCLETIEHVVTPLMRWVGSQWHEGRLRVAHEHMATSSVRAHLEHVYTSVRSEAAGPGVVLATLPQQRHEIGILMCAVVAVLEGWRAHYFGLELPVADIAVAASHVRAELVALGLSTIGDGQELLEQLAELRDALPVGTRLVVGGPAAMNVNEDVERLGIQCLERIDQFQELLREYGTK
ncbi:MAG: MerR family transcriptional regulator [Candidatus Hydrogenedentes bacterium]|nr:MerR family transcriptional regulator [Candidatus Hydrogenedentota bacterium]